MTKYIDVPSKAYVDKKLDKSNPTGTGALSLNRKEDTTVGPNSFAVGENCTASERASFAIGAYTQATGPAAYAEGNSSEATGPSAHAEGNKTKAYENSAHAEGASTLASGVCSHAEGSYVEATAYAAHAEGYYSKATGQNAHAEGGYCYANGAYSHAEGGHTVAASTAQHVQGKYNVEDANNTYADIVGWGSSTAAKNISALTTEGDLRLKGNVYIGCNDDSTGGTLVQNLTAGNGIQIVNGVISCTFANGNEVSF